MSRKFILRVVIAAGTIDGFQGNEKDLTIVVLTAAANSGLGFVANQESLRMALTRHRQSLIALGDERAKGAVPGRATFEKLIQWITN